MSNNNINCKEYETERNKILEKIDEVTTDGIRQLQELKVRFINEVALKKGDMFVVHKHFYLLEDLKGVVADISVNDNFHPIITYYKVLKDGSISNTKRTYVCACPQYIEAVENR